MNNTSLTDLKAVIALANHRNFRSAAVELDMSSSALSRNIAQLEHHLGIRLFNRTTRSVSLTEAGLQFLNRITPALEQIDLAVQETLDRRATPSGTLRINAEEGMSRQILHSVIIEYIRRYPDVRVDLVSDGEFIDIVKEGFDAGIRFASTVPQDMVAIEIGPKQSMAVVATPAYLNTHGMPHIPSDLLKHECIRLRLPSGKIYKWEFTQNNESLTVDVSGHLTIDTYMLAIDSALSGIGLAYTGHWFVAPLIEQGRLIRVLEEWTPHYAGLCLYYPQGKHPSAALRAFIDLAREQRLLPSYPIL
ncbi:LysR family transcriptional regulator [Acinetobacter pittii]|jgi:DNA-binding transcriptional LysR family regulator|uniref:LysR family transcriptional regulator n=1 Tax=Acinetobacter pittii TaxID=48296 RepID=UPI001CD6D539|nr:LysR family transcriptional regulator [Acinetobacter pittii]MDX8254047.1 LysR family transcriptional regulator [Acinetobacter pittii]